MKPISLNIDSRVQPSEAQKVVSDALKYAMGGPVAMGPVGEREAPVAMRVEDWAQAHGRAQRNGKVAKLLTATLETSLHHLDDLRRTLERTNQKNIADVRKAGGWGADLLAAIEGTITYYDLVQLVYEMRDGIAARRVAAKDVA